MMAQRVSDEDIAEMLQLTKHMQLSNQVTDALLDLQDMRNQILRLKEFVIWVRDAEVEELMDEATDRAIELVGEES